MVFRWNCRQCNYDAWSANEESLINAMGSHTLSHYRNKLQRRDFGVGWDCPYCGQSTDGYDEEKSVDQFKQHLTEHVRPLVQSNVHIADEINGVGNVLVRAPVNSQRATNARIHFTSPADFALFVTSQPAKRIQLLANELSEWPSWTTILTTKQQPFAEVTDIDVESAPMEVVILDKRCGLTEAGETVARILDEQETSSAKVTVGFDIISELLELFELRTVFKFLHILNARLGSVDALTHYYLDPNNHQQTAINMLSELFDLTLSAQKGIFVSN